MPPKSSADASAAITDQRDALVGAFSQLHNALSNCARQLEAFTHTLANTPKGLVDPTLLANAAHTTLAALTAFGMAPDTKFVVEPVAGKKRKERASVDGQAKKTRVKKEKDPDQPKRPASAYLLYQNAVRAEYQGKFPDLSYHDVLGKIAESWQVLDDKVKKGFTDANAKLKAEYEVRKSTYDKEKVAKGLAAAAAEEEDEEDEEEEDQLAASPPKPDSGHAAVAPTLAPKTNGGVARHDPDEEEDEPEHEAAAVPEPDEDEDESDETDDTKQVAKVVQQKDVSDESDDDDDDDEEDEPPKKKVKNTPSSAQPKKAKGAAAKPPSASKAAKTPKAPKAAAARPPTSKDEGSKKKRKKD